MSPEQIFALRLTTIGCATIIVIVAGIVAARVANSRGQWWLTLGALALAAFMIWVGYVLIESSTWSRFG